MDPACKFGLEYQPLGKLVDPVVKMHVRNCRDCQRQVTFV